MGNALTIMIVPEELIGHARLHIWDQKLGAYRRVERDGEAAEREQVLAEYPDAFLLLPVPPGSVWQPPEEPWREHGLSWHRNRRLVVRHERGVRDSLERYLNGRLRRLERMVRTGWFRVERVHAQIILRGSR
jgi:hypothetical protein